MVVNIIIAIIVVSIIIAAIIMNWIQRQEFCKLVDDIFELLINPKTQYLSIHKWDINITVQVINIGNEVFNGTKSIDLTKKYSIFIMRKEDAVGISIWVKLRKGSSDVVYERHAQLSR